MSAHAAVFLSYLTRTATSSRGPTVFWLLSVPLVNVSSLHKLRWKGWGLYSKLLCEKRGKTHLWYAYRTFFMLTNFCTICTVTKHCLPSKNFLQYSMIKRTLQQYLVPSQFDCFDHSTPHCFIFENCLSFKMAFWICMWFIWSWFCKNFALWKIPTIWSLGLANKTIAITKVPKILYLLRDIVNNNCSLCTTVVHSTDTVKPFCSCCVPYMKLHFSVAPGYYCLCCESSWRRDSRIVTEVEGKREGRNELKEKTTTTLFPASITKTSSD